ncbi:MAG: transcription termination factor NusA [Oscillospiraceae bacterium]|nr:transcription termination factor NusA [Oscillospiraceae bacterium]
MSNMDDFFNTLSVLGSENSLDTEVMIQTIKSAMQKSVQRMYPECKESIRVDIDVENRIFEIFLLQEVVDDMPFNHTEISLDEARTIKPDAVVGEIIEHRLDISKFSRASAQSAKQSIKGDLRDINRDRILEKFQSKENDIITATVTQVEPGRGSATLMYDKTELYLLRQEQIPGEILKEGMSVKVYITGIANRNKKPIIKLSRVHRDLVKRLFELEVPEIYDGIVEIKSISREAGSRSKIAVVSHDENVDAIGSCIGAKHSRISAVVKELNGEKIDIIPYSEDPAQFIANALSPAKVLKVIILSEEERTCVAVVPADQLSLAIGNRGQNAKLAAKLTGYKIDIKSETDEIPEPVAKLDTEPNPEADEIFLDADSNSESKSNPEEEVLFEEDEISENSETISEE